MIRAANLGRYRLRLLLIGGFGGLFLLMLTAIALGAWAMTVGQRDQAIRVDLRRLEVLIEQFQVDARHYLANAPRDYPDYWRDTTIYYTQLQDNIGRIDRLLTALAFPGDERGHGPWIGLLLATPAARDERFMDLYTWWRTYTERMNERLGPNRNEPRLEWAAQHIVTQAPEFDRRIEAASRQLQNDIRAHQSRVRVIGQWGLALLLAVAAIGIAVLTFSLIRRLGATQRGCEMIAMGYFGHQIPDRSNDELSLLNQAINAVSTRMQAVLAMLDGIQKGADLRATAESVRIALGTVATVDWIGLFVKVEEPQALQWREQAPELLPATDIVDVQTVPTCAPYTVCDAADVLPKLAAALRQHGLNDAVTIALPAEAGSDFLLVLASRRAGSFEPTTRTLLHNIAPIIGHGFEKSALSEQLLLAAINGLSKLAESRDPDTGDHLVRMSHYAYETARALQQQQPEAVSTGFVRDVLRFAAMHDIGKVGIPDAILLKSGPLSDSERAEMYLHPLIGGSVLRACAAQLPAASRNLFQVAIDIAEGHHERFDGSGYPFGRRGAAIPLAARIVAVADVFDALTSRRSYKPAWPLESGIEYLRAHAGSHFDPQVVAAFVAARPHIESIYRRWRHV